MALPPSDLIQRPRSVATTPEGRTRRRRARSGKLTVVFGDLAVLAIALAVASTLRSFGPDGWIGVLAFVVAYPLWMVRQRLYSVRFLTRRTDEIRRVVNASMFCLATIAVALYFGNWAVDRRWVIIAIGLSTLLLIVHRELVRRRFVVLRRSGELVRSVLLVGANDEADELEELFASDPLLGYRTAGRIDPTEVTDPRLLTTRVLNEARTIGAGSVLLASSGVETQTSNRLVRDLLEAGVHVELSSTLADISPSRLTIRPLGRFPIAYIEPVQRNGWRSLAKRSFDVGASLLGLVALSPALLVVAIAVKRSSPGPILFRQERVGQDARPFGMLKFRTMVVNAEELLDDLMEENESDGPLFKMRDDPRITRVGAFLRKTSIDELPQLWNVVRGEMSLVGPRPALASEMADWEADLYGRLRVKPGVTGMWQVSGRSTTSFDEYTRLDLYYVDNWSLVVDLAILAKTIPAVLRSDGAY